MNIFLGYESALKYWQTADLDPRHIPSRLRPEAGQAPSSADITASAALDFAGDDGRVHVVVARDSDRRRGLRMHCRVYDASADRNAFLKIADGLYVATPEVLFFQMAGVLPVVDLVELGFTLTSGYAEDERASDGMRKRSPLTSVSALRRYTLSRQGAKGYKKAACALLYVCDNSASPMETLLAMLLFLPCYLGGYGFKRERLNYRIDKNHVRKLSPLTQGLPGECLRCDIYWPDLRLAIEYDSSSHHTGIHAIVRDSDRRSMLGLLGVNVIAVTGGQVFDVRALDRIALLISKQMGRRMRIRTKGWLTKRRGLWLKLTDERKAAYRQYMAAQPNRMVEQPVIGTGSAVADRASSE
jgi:very-short-patch-repair endonuclease